MTNQTTLEWVMNQMEWIPLDPTNEGELRVYNAIHNLLYHAQTMKKNNKKHYDIGESVRITDGRVGLQPNCMGIGEVVQVNEDSVGVQTNAGFYTLHPVQISY